MADVTRVDAELGQRARASLVLSEQLVSVEMKITDDGNLTIELGELLDDMRHRARGSVIVDGDADQFRAGIMQQFDLRHGRGDIGGIGIGHRLHHYGSAAAHADAGNVYAVSVTTLVHLSACDLDRRL